jgi:hypothetical protein
MQEIIQNCMAQDFSWKVSALPLLLYQTFVLLTADVYTSIGMDNEYSCRKMQFS